MTSDSSVPDILILLGLRWLICTGILHGVLRLQGLPINRAGILVTAGLAAGALFLSHLGLLLAYGVMFVGLKLATRADASELVFSIVIAEALMYVCAVLLLSAALPGMSVGIRLPDLLGKPDSTGTGEAGAVQENTPAEPQPVRPLATDAVISRFSVKGVSMTKSNALAILQADGTMHTLGRGEALTLKTPDGLLRIVCETITRTNVILVIQDTDPPEKFELKLE